MVGYWDKRPHITPPLPFSLALRPPCFCCSCIYPEMWNVKNNLFASVSVSLYFSYFLVLKTLVSVQALIEHPSSFLLKVDTYFDVYGNTSVPHVISLTLYWCLKPAMAWHTAGRPFTSNPPSLSHIENADTEQPSPALPITKTLNLFYIRLMKRSREM